MTALSTRGILAAFACTFAVHLLVYEGPVTGYWDTYIAAPALHLQGREAQFHLEDGSPAYPHTRLVGRLPDDLIDRSPGGFGVISEDQRLGAAVIVSPFYRAFGLFGFRAVHAFAWGISAALVTATAMALGMPVWVAVISGLVFALNPYSLSVNRLNANVISLPALAAILWLLFAAPATAAVGRAAVMGLFLGVLGGVRNECVLLIPALAVALGTQPMGVENRLRALLAAATTALLTLLPALVWQRWAFGRWLIHASQFEGFEGFRPVFVHSIGPWQFEFNGLLNWPFHEQLIRTPHFPYPTYVLLPLVVVRSFGVIGVALALTGLGVLWRRRSALAACVTLWIAALWGMLSVQENWEELKMTYLVLLFPAAALPFAEGLRWMTGAAGVASSGPGDGTPRLPLRILAFSLVAAVVWSGAYTIGALAVPADARWWQRFPHAAVNRAGYAELPHELRWSWEFFHSGESDSELRRERDRLWPPGLFPRTYRARSVSIGEEIRRMAGEAETTSLRTLAIWKYIYAPPGES
jgi:hypothetical protein